MLGIRTQNVEFVGVKAFWDIGPGQQANFTVCPSLGRTNVNQFIEDGAGWYVTAEAFDQFAESRARTLQRQPGGIAFGIMKIAFPAPGRNHAGRPSRPR